MTKKRSLRRGLATVVAGVAVVGLVAGCGDKIVKKSDLQSQIKEKASAAATGSKIGDVHCDSDLKGKVGSTSNCTAQIDGKQVALVATVTKVTDKIYYNISLAK
ncbi:DUF4333 domain-containing protein [Flexivirga caeni]|uniref:DUF4333 domain-containing protein n=1 Tax=Flexivirga caeni TaxID=2294115 RepID=UPI0013159B0C|nr:DUF4333 domain-containing protein [Flexivirga caeni]